VHCILRLQPGVPWPQQPAPFVVELKWGAEFNGPRQTRRIRM
jgi:hypothetical protein